MAQVKNQSVPPSLIDDYERLVGNAKTQSGQIKQARIRPSVRRPDPPDPQRTDAEFAGRAAAWLRDAWLPNGSSAERSQFYADRRGEILSGTFQTNYWAMAAQIADYTERCVPAVTAYEGDWNPAYFDPLRQPSTCTYTDVSNVYNTPPAPGTESQPAPGWKGTVIGGIWRDMYHAQRRLVFSLPFVVAEDEPRPIALRIAANISATATIRGNRNWFVVIVKPVYHRNTQTPFLEKGACVHWARADGYPYAIPEDDPGGWSYAKTRAFTRNGARHAVYEAKTGMNRLSLRVATPPSLGLYGSRNDAVEVYHDITATVALAKPP